jgi:hypothetical protein
MVILIQDNYLSDIAYVDYLVNLIAAIKDASAHQSVSFFNSLDSITNKHLRIALIDIARELHN